MEKKRNYNYRIPEEETTMETIGRALLQVACFVARELHPESCCTGASIPLNIFKSLTVLVP